MSECMGEWEIIESPEDGVVSSGLKRMRVEGGWIYLSSLYDYRGTLIGLGGMTFVPFPIELEKESVS